MKLLLAEDEKDLSDAIKKILELNNYDVDAVYDGEDALFFAQHSNYDGIILDVMMPKLSGIEVVKKLRLLGIGVPVLILTAKAETDDKVLGLDSGADDYLTKPFVIKELLARIRALTRRKGENNLFYRFGNLILDPTQYELKANSAVRLTNKEYRLMEFLIKNHNVLLSTERILTSVWEFDTEVELNVVWVFISSLRKKMKQIGANCEITAARGVGYRLEEKMIKRVKRKFILVTMISVFLVLLVIIALINLINYSKIASYADNVLTILYEHGGTFSIPDRDNIVENEEQNNNNFNDGFQGDQKPKPDGINPETPYETRYFTVKFTDSEMQVDVKNIAAVSKDEAITLANKAVNKNKNHGYLGIYRFLVADNKTFVLFIDCGRQIDTANNFLLASVIISIFGLVSVFVLSLVLSKLAVKPIAESYEKQKRFITDASHELKTPLTIISANNELIELSTGVTQETSNITKQVNRMTSMVKNLTVLAKFDETNKLLNKNNFSLTDMLIDMATIYRPSIEKNNRIFEVKIEKDFIINGDEALIRQAFYIIFDNAAKYAKTKVSLKGSEIKDSVTIELVNDADGIIKGNLNRCFERFYRMDNARASNVWGSGIGLSIAKSIIELHNGQISAWCEEKDLFKIKIILHIAK